jgi:lysozyme|tara:strand:+ start:120 stop:545 length:426 start_codon:yes stop_codon:yes gene_type:complete
MSLEERLMEHEGFIPKIYKDTRGLATIGYGHLVTKQDPFIEDVEYPEEELYDLFLKDLQKAKNGAEEIVGHIKELHPTAKEIITEMVYQLGVTGVRRFLKTLLHLENRDYKNASMEMLDSAWRKQTPKRCEKLSKMMAECA